MWLKNQLRKIKAKIIYVKATYRTVRNRMKKVRNYPTTIQLPITYLCNFDCVMCGMHHMIQRKDFTVEEFKQIISDKLFKKVKSVGINGGEPFLKKDLIEFIQILVDTLPKLRVFYMISNGFFTDKILEQLTEIKRIAEKKGIMISLAISVDGINDMQDFHRGKKDAFVNANRTIELILENKSQYVDYLNVICTITRYNIERINEVAVWADNLGIDVSYNIATVNARIENEDRVDSFSVFSDEHARMLTEEFFYCKYRQTGDEKYFSLYLYLKTGKRYSDCPCMYNEWVTLTPDTQIGYCATHSKNLGSGLDESPYDIVQNNLPYLDEIKETFCENCSHYSYKLNAKGLKEMYKDRMENIF